MGRSTHGARHALHVGLEQITLPIRDVDLSGDSKQLVLDEAPGIAGVLGRRVVAFGGDLVPLDLGKALAEYILEAVDSSKGPTEEFVTSRKPLSSVNWRGERLFEGAMVDG